MSGVVAGGRTLPHVLVPGAGVAILMVGAVAWLAPTALLPVLLLTPAALMGVVLLRHPVPALIAWLLIAGTSPEMWLGTIVPGTDSASTAAVKVFGLLLVLLCILREGFRADPFNPGLAFVVMFFTGIAHGLLPMLTLGDSLRSLIGSAAPYAFSFARLPRRWCDAIITTTMWVPSAIVLFGAVLAALNLYPMFADDDGIRLSGSTHPAFLATFAMTGVYAALIELFREGRLRHQLLMALNFVILLAAGGRGALFGAVVVSAAAFLFLPSAAFPRARRLPAILLGGLTVAVALAATSGGSEIRILNVLSTQAGSLSGRDLIWPYFEQAWNASPWVGWGVGAGKAVVDPDSLLAHLLGTTAAHDEYLRIGVEGGYVGLALLIGLFVAWGFLSTRPMAFAERITLRLILLAFAVHAVTDNVLIAAPASVYFAWMSAVFGRARAQSAFALAPVIERRAAFEPTEARVRYAAGPPAIR